MTGATPTTSTAPSAAMAAQRLPPRSVLVGVAVAAFFWFLLFSPATALSQTLHAEYFWFGMVVATALLGGASLWVQRAGLRRLFRFERRFIWIALGHALLLYGLSRFGV